MALTGARVSGRYRKTPFFVVTDGKPIAVPQVLSAEERQAIMGKL
jgi:hypothetical protein